MAFEGLARFLASRDTISLVVDLINMWRSGSIKESVDKLLRRGGSKSATASGTTPPTGEAPSAAPHEPTITTNTMGQSDERGIIYLTSLYPADVRDPKVVHQPVERKYAVAFGRLYTFFSDGEGTIFTRILARGGMRNIAVKVTVPLPTKKTRPAATAAGAPAPRPATMTKEFVIEASVIGSSLVRAIGKDILSAGRDEAAQTARAEALVRQFRKAGILDNLSDSAKEFWGTVRPVVVATGPHVAAWWQRRQQPLPPMRWLPITLGGLAIGIIGVLTLVMFV